jgi:hypothetical protein
VLLGILALSSVSGNSQMLELRNHRAFSMPFFRMSPFTRMLSKKSELTVSITESNDESQLISGSNIMEEDGEFSRLFVQSRKKFGKGEIALSGTMLAFHGGILDKVIEVLHRTLLGSTDPLRDDSPDGRSFVMFNDNSWGRGAGIGNFSATYTQAVDRKWIGSVGVKLPVGIGSSLADSRSLDIGIGLGRSFKFSKRWSADFHLGVVHQGSSPEFRNVRRLVDAEAVAFLWQANSKDQWIFQFMSEASALRSGIAFADSAHRSVAIGYRTKDTRGRTWELFFAEDFDPLDGFDLNRKQVGPDIVIGVTVRIGSG